MNWSWKTGDFQLLYIKITRLVGSTGESLHEHLNMNKVLARWIPQNVYRPIKGDTVDLQ